MKKWIRKFKEVLDSYMFLFARKGNTFFVLLNHTPLPISITFQALLIVNVKKDRLVCTLPFPVTVPTGNLRIVEQTCEEINEQLSKGQFVLDWTDKRVDYVLCLDYFPAGTLSRYEFTTALFSAVTVAETYCTKLLNAVMGSSFVEMPDASPFDHDDPMRYSFDHWLPGDTPSDFRELDVFPY